LELRTEHRKHQDIRTRRANSKCLTPGQGKLWAAGRTWRQDCQDWTHPAGHGDEVYKKKRRKLEVRGKKYSRFLSSLLFFWPLLVCCQCKHIRYLSVLSISTTSHSLYFSPKNFLSVCLWSAFGAFYS